MYQDKELIIKKKSNCGNENEHYEVHELCFRRFKILCKHIRMLMALVIILKCYKPYKIKNLETFLE